MREAAALSALYFSFALVHAADSRRLWPGLCHWKLCNRTGMRILAALSVAAGMWFLRRAYDATSAVLVALTALSAIGTLFVLLVPLFPRTIWGLALACPPLVILFALLVEQHG
ncbi:MAG TPA: hypothetical protein VK550_15145 [Polyangiaceae bacterium]|nr:hypothetical protein [Polyangiaceae bacterium]